MEKLTAYLQFGCDFLNFEKSNKKKNPFYLLHSPLGCLTAPVHAVLWA